MAECNGKCHKPAWSLPINHPECPKHGEGAGSATAESGKQVTPETAAKTLELMSALSDAVTPKKFDYEFRIWPSSDRWPKFENKRIGKLRREALHMSINGVMLELTEEEFDGLRFELNRMGYDLHEICRKPHVEWEIIL